jgi:replicative DNA helicase
MTNNDIEVPYSQEAEEAVIGAVLTNPVAYLNVSEFLKAEDFFFIKHTYIWEAMRNLAYNGVAIDTVTLSHRLQAVGHLKEIGGPAFLTQLVRNVPTSVHAEVYGRLVERTAARRRLMMVGDEIKAMAADEEVPVEKIFEQSEARLLDVTGRGVQQKSSDIKDIAHKYMTTVENLAELRSQGKTPGLPTGFVPVDEIIGGAYRDEIVIWAAPPKCGKSTINLNVARNRAKLGARVVIFITEMNEAAVVRKFISMETGIPMAALKDVDFTPQEYSRFVKAISGIAKWPVHIIDKYKALTPIDVRRELRNIAQEHVIDSVLIDGLWMMRSNSEKRVDRYIEVSDIMKDLVAIASDFHVPIDLVHQCNRAAEGRKDKRFRLSDLAESSGAAQNAYTVIGLYRKSYYDRGGLDEIEVIIAANRDGQS